MSSPFPPPAQNILYPTGAGPELATSTCGRGEYIQLTAAAKLSEQIKDVAQCPGKRIPGLKDFGFAQTIMEKWEERLARTGDGILTRKSCEGLGRGGLGPGIMCDETTRGLGGVKSTARCCLIWACLSR